MLYGHGVKSIKKISSPSGLEGMISCVALDTFGGVILSVLESYNVIHAQIITKWVDCMVEPKLSVNLVPSCYALPKRTL